MDAVNILLVDDDRSLVTTLSQGLRKAMGEGIMISVCFSSSEALSSLALQRFDLVISDFHLPGMTGLELLKAIRREHGETPLILVTAFGSHELEREAHRQAMGYITKPFELPMLVQLIKSHLWGRTTSGATNHSPHTVGNNEIPDRPQRGVFVGQEGSNS